MVLTFGNVNVSVTDVVFAGLEINAWLAANAHLGHLRQVKTCITETQNTEDRLHSQDVCITIFTFISASTGPSTQ